MRNGIHRDNSSPARANRMTASAATAFIRERYAPLRNSPKLLARLSGMSPKQCGKWLRGEAEPSAGALITLARNDDEFRAHLISYLEKAS